MLTSASEVWNGEFGRQYTERNDLSANALDAHYFDTYGITRTKLNEQFLHDVPKDAAILEVGCNLGTQLELLQDMGYTNLSGCDIQKAAIDTARVRLPNMQFCCASTHSLPYQSNQFDLVFTSGLLIHIAPSDLSSVMHEIARVTRRWIWGFEYWSDSIEVIPYRGCFLWKMDYAEQYQEACNQLRLIKQELLAYIGGPKMDSMFLLAKNENR